MEDKLNQLQELHSKLSIISNEIYFITNLEKFNQNELTLTKNSPMISNETKKEIEAIFNEMLSKLRETSQKSKKTSKELLREISKLTKKIN